MNLNKNLAPIFWLALGFGVAAVAAGCAAPADSAEVKSDKERLSVTVPEDDIAELVSGNSAFAFDLYRSLRAGSGDNLFYSPYSISLALAMTHAGARGETERQMGETLHYALSQAKLHPTFNALDTSLSSAGNVEEAFQLNIANAIWGQDGYDFLEAYLDLLAENYGAGLRTLDFAGDPEAARETINSWVSEQTEEKIKNLIAPGVLNSSTRLVLTNAIYFNGQWLLQFEESVTYDDTFTLLDGSPVNVPMMTQTETFRYAQGDAQGDGYQAITLPYQGANMSMVLILPEDGRFEEIEEGFTVDFLDRLDDGWEFRPVDLTMPKFEFESEFNLSSTLAGMGMPDAFGGEADFSGMTGNRDLFISDVVHKAFVAVDEAGTEAAAATAVVMAEMAAAPLEDVVTMKLDRPFLFLIRDDDTGTILFAGRVMNPQN